MTEMRTGQAPAPLTREQFRQRFNVRFYDPAFDAERDAIVGLEATAWDALQEGRKAPMTRPAGTGFADPSYALSLQWLDTRARLRAAQKLWGDSAAPSRVLLVCGSARKDGTCPSEVSKTWRLAVKSGLATLADGVSRRHPPATAFLAGIGFTLALFISGLAFPGTPCK